VPKNAVGGAAAMIVHAPSSLQEFCERFSSGLTKVQKELLPVLLTGILLGRGKRTQVSLARGVKTKRRHKSSISRLFRRARFRTRDLVAEVTRELVEKVSLGGREAKRTWVFIIDGTATKRGSYTKIENALQYRKKSTKSKGKSTKAHTFLMGLLITDTGARIPVPRRTYYTKPYCKKRRRVHRTQQQLAKLMIQEGTRLIPKGVHLVVLADEYFEGGLLSGLCRKLKHTFIVPVDSRRTFSDDKGSWRTRTLHERGKARKRAARDFVLVRGQEETASYRRQLPRRAGPKDVRRYRVAHETRDVAKLGPTQVVYSWKRSNSRPQGDPSSETYKVLVCTDLSLPAEKVVEWFELRWQIELWFKELKSHLGMGDFGGQDFQAFERHVDLVMLAFASQEWRRVELLQKRPPPKVQAQLAGARTCFMKELLDVEAQEGDSIFLDRCMKVRRFRDDIYLEMLPLLKAA
jgi:SRSO17 transposase